MSVLDDQDYLRARDPEGFLAVVEELPRQIAAGWETGKAVPVDPQRKVDGIVVLGMGGSGISGDVVKAMLGPRFRKPVEVSKGYDPPGWAGPSTLVFAVSYSGETEETLEACEKAASAGAQVVTVSTGGTLAKLGESNGFPAVTVEGGLQPRAALGHMAFGILGVLQSLGLGSFEPEVAETVALLERRKGRWGRSIPQEDNPAKTLAAQLEGSLPVIYGSAGIAGVAAYRWKCQLNECSKVFAWWNEFSELNHNEVVGWADRSAGPLALVVLRHPGEHRRIAERVDVTLPLLPEPPALTRVVAASGSSPTARLMDLIYLGDMVATYLALVRGVDPAAIEIIDRIKRELG